jgi:hypothetical protein
LNRTKTPCYCRACDIQAAREEVATLEAAGVEVTETTRLFMRVSWLRINQCGLCGHKRCAKATYHGNECHHSNLPGQPGSDYACSATP